MGTRPQECLQAFLTIICKLSKQAPIVQWLLKLSERPLYSPLNRHFHSPNLHHAHHCTIIKLLRKQDWAYLLRISFPHSSEQKAISSLYFFVSTYGFQQCLCCDQAITMICRGHVINKMANVYKKTFPVSFVVGELLQMLLVTCCKCEKSSYSFKYILFQIQFSGLCRFKS